MEQLHEPSSDSESELSISTATSSFSDSVSSISTSDSSLSDSESSSSTSSSSSSSDSVSSTTSTSPDLESSIYTSLPDCNSSTSIISCFFDPSTCQRQRFSIPEKIVYYLTKNCTNAEIFQKLVESCKYFYTVNPVIVVPYLKSESYESSGKFFNRWSIFNDEKSCFVFKNPQTLNFKIWVTRRFSNYYLSTSDLVPKIYKNDATSVHLRTNDQKWEEFLFFAGNAESLYMSNQTIKYENGEIVPFEKIVESLPNLKILHYTSHGDGSDITLNTFNKLMEIEHFKHISYLSLYNIPEELNVDKMFNYILENKHVLVWIYYRCYEVSHALKERIREYSNRLQNEKGCNSHIGYFDTDDDSSDDNSSSDESIYDDDSDSFEDDEEGLLFPWNNEEDEEWELPWDTD